ncbi:hypothetical protein NG799_24420 [Laspinema sp. D1]|uniref:Uncharacterized protein n=1 Tax=Laspinema palackyanum D2a TaxID=2953684 RepID=A0ABT2MZZ6_9CYAN|nr:hypothetical protein [Laspinema sp. D2a]
MILVSGTFDTPRFRRSHSGQDCPNINNPALLKNRVVDIGAFKFLMASVEDE